MKKKLAIVYEIKENDIPKLISQIDKYKKTLKMDSIFLFFNNLTEEAKTKINKTYPCIFVKTSKIIKPKFEIFKYLENYETVVYTNLAIELNCQLIEKYKKETFSSLVSSNCYVESNFKKLKSKYKMLINSINSNLIIITDKIEKFKSINIWCKIFSIVNYFSLRNRVDGTLDVMLQKFNMPVVPIKLNNSADDGSILKYDHKKIVSLNKKIKSGPLVSVLMSIYNRIDYIDNAINSILEQTYQNIEFIIVLEYSSGQDEIYKSLLKYKDSRIKIIKNKTKLGFAESLNIGIKNTKGKYLARVDDDDISVPNRIEKQVEFLESNKDISIVGSFMQFFGNSNLVCELPCDSEILKVKCLYKTPLFHPTVMIRLKDFKKYKLYYKNNTYAEDYELWSRAIENLQIANIPEILYFYQLNGKNNSIGNEMAMNQSHHNIMSYQLHKYLKMNLSYDELQLLSGRIDVLGNSINLKQLYRKKIKIWQKILRKNKKIKFYSNAAINNEISEIKSYYKLLMELRK